jgi:hypothetical protein
MPCGLLASVERRFVSGIGVFSSLGSSAYCHATVHTPTFHWEGIRDERGPLIEVGALVPSARRTSLRTLGLVGLLLLVAAMPAGALSLHLVPASGAVLPGATVPVSLLLSDLGDGDALGSFDIEIAIEGGALSLATVRLGEFGSSDAQLFDLDARVDGFRLRWVSLASPEHLDAQQPAGFEIAGFEVEAQHAGVARLVFASVSLGDAVGSGLAIDSSDAARIAVIPEASTIALLAGGLASLSLRRAGRRCP